MQFDYHHGQNGQLHLGGGHMGFTLSMCARLYLRGIVDNYMLGRACPDEFVDQAKREVRQLENFLFSSSSFLRMLEVAKHYHPTKGRPIYTSTLAHANSHRITLLGIPIHLTIPLHDHPDMVSIVAFLSGWIRSPIYRVISKDCGYNRAELMNCSEQTYSQGDITILTSETGTLHSMEALTHKSVCLSIQLSMLSSFSKQSYYFPAAPDVATSERALWWRAPFRGHPNGA
jgi:hypothetical protein